MLGHVSWGLETLISKITRGPLRVVAILGYTFLPDHENFNYKTEIVHHLAVPVKNMVFSVGYGFFYTRFILALAVIVFQKRDFI